MNTQNNATTMPIIESATTDNPGCGTGYSFVIISVSLIIMGSVFASPFVFVYLVWNLIF